MSRRWNREIVKEEDLEAKAVELNKQGYEVRMVYPNMVEWREA